MSFDDETQTLKYHTSGAGQEVAAGVVRRRVDDALGEEICGGRKGPSARGFRQKDNYIAERGVNATREVAAGVTEEVVRVKDRLIHRVRRLVAGKQAGEGR